MRTLLLALLALSNAAPALTLDEILAKNLAARAEPRNVAKLQTLRLTAAPSSPGRAGGARPSRWPGPRCRSGRGASASEATRQGLTAVQAWNGKEGWKLSPFRGRREPERASQDDARALAQDAGHRRAPGLLAREGEQGRVPGSGGRRRHARPQAARRAEGRRRPVRVPRSDAFLEIRVVTSAASAAPSR